MISNVFVYGFAQSVHASGYPMSTTIKPIELDEYKDAIKRASKLSHAKPGSGHDCFLKGIVVQADVTAPQYWWQQFQRYHFADIVSSQSKMHRLLKMDLWNQCNEYVDDDVIRILEKHIELYNHPYNKDKKEYYFMKIISNCPMGLNLTARITTNYLQLKTIHEQRKHHKLPEWHTFCEWIESLPNFKELVL